MKISGKVALGVLSQSTPYILLLLATSTHPALAAVTGGITEVSTGANYIQTTFLAVGGVIASIGIGSGAVHLAHHKEDWAGGAGRIGAGVVGATVVAKAPSLATMFAPATF